MIAATAAAVVITGCAAGPAEIPPSLDRAAMLVRQGDQAGAARVYEALARQNTGAHRNDLVFASAHAYLAARLPDDAVRVSSVLEQPLTPEQAIQRDLLEVETALARGQLEQAWQRINSINPPRNFKQLAVNYMRLKQRIALASNRLVDAVAAEDALEPYLADTEGLQGIRDSRGQLLASLRDASEHGARVDPRASKDAVIRAWLELAPLAVAAARDPGGTTSDVQAWLARHPNHPASEAVRSQLLQHKPPPPVVTQQAVVPGMQAPGAVTAAVPAPAQAQAQAQELPPPAAPAPGTAPTVAAPPLSPPMPGETVIALLLPLDGRQAAAGAIVRDGFMTAYYQAAVTQRPRVRLYDTNGQGISEVVARATQEGANFIVGPLARDEVTTAAELSGARPPILALNFLASEHPIPADFYQYALSPENEARLAAHRMLDEGRRQGVALVPEGDWGTRVLAAFKQEIEAGGGAVLAAATIDTRETDFSEGITQVLRITESRARHKRLEQVLGTKLQFEPRRRNDIDFIFTPAQAKIERMMRPQLRFHYAGSIPNYATSDAFEPDPRANQDLEGLMLPEMPWILGGDLADSVRSAAQTAWPNGVSLRNRLFAFGFDAYRLAIALRAATGSVAIDGLTGRLTLDPEHRVHRDLNWVQIQRGEPKPLPAPGAAAGAQASLP